jgi:hypothetical protein
MYQFYTLQRWYNFTHKRVSPLAWVGQTRKHFRGEWLGIHYEAFIEYT